MNQHIFQILRLRPTYNSKLHYWFECRTSQDKTLYFELRPKGGFNSERAGEFVISPNRQTKLFF
jgi:hypothetical protein